MFFSAPYELSYLDLSLSKQNTHIILISVSKYFKITMVMKMLYTYTEAQEKYGSSYQLDKAVKRGDLFKLSRGLYSNNSIINPYAAVSKKHPDSIITMDSAFFIHGMTDVIPDRIHLATKRNALRIRDKSIRQYFIEERLFVPGRVVMDFERTSINIYSLERMLVELMRNSARMPLDYYKEIIASYRERIESLDIRAIEGFISLFERNDYLFQIFQREVL